MFHTDTCVRITIGNITIYTQPETAKILEDIKDTPEFKWVVRRLSNSKSSIKLLLMDIVTQFCYGETGQYINGKPFSNPEFSGLNKQILYKICYTLFHA